MALHVGIAEWGDLGGIHGFFPACWQLYHPALVPEWKLSAA